MRGLLLTLALALGGAHAAAAAAVADPPPPTSFESSAVTRWLGANIDSTGWQIADVSSKEALYIQSGLKTGPAMRPVRAYARWERFARSTAADPWRSALQLLEVDCVNGRFRELSWAAYAGSNFSGEMIENAPNEAEPWRAAADGSIMLAALAKACPGAVVRRGAPVQGAAGASAPSR